MKKFAFLYGAQKCGTTWLSKNLKRSPETYNGGLKEWRLFNWYFSTRKPLKYLETDYSKVDELRYKMRSSPLDFMEEQARIVHSDPTLSVLADFTPGLASHLSIENFRELKNLWANLELEARGILLIRDPVTRVLSQISMIISNSESSPRPWKQQWRLSQFDCPEVEAVDQLVDKFMNKITPNSQFDRMLEKVIALESEIPSLVMTTDDLFSDHGLDLVTDFLGISKIEIDHRVANRGQHAPIGIETKRKIARSLEGTYQYMEKYFGAEGFPKSWWPSLELLK